MSEVGKTFGRRIMGPSGFKIFASKLGSCIGWNPYETPAQCAKALRAYRFPKTLPQLTGLIPLHAGLKPQRWVQPDYVSPRYEMEAEALRLYQNTLDGKVIQPGQLIHSQLFENVVLSGVPDGIVDDCIVEIKCRQNWLLPQAPLRDVAQVYAYMHLANLRRAVIVQHNQGRLSVQTVHWEQDVWDYIHLMLDEFAWMHRLTPLAHSYSYPGCHSQ